MNAYRDALNHCAKPSMCLDREPLWHELAVRDHVHCRECGRTHRVRLDDGSYVAVQWTAVRELSEWYCADDDACSLRVLFLETLGVPA